MQIDEGRGRLYVSDAGPQNIQGVVVLELATQSPVARIMIANPSGLAISSSGNRLAVASENGFVALLDLDALTVTKTVYFTEGQMIALAWDVGFIGEDRALVTLTQSYNEIGGYHQALIVNFTSGSVDTWFSPDPFAFTAFASVRVDDSRQRAYIIDGETVYAYDVGTATPTLVASRTDANFTRDAVLSPDGSELYFASGKVYDALTLAFVDDLRDTGSVSLGSFGAHVYYAAGIHLDVVRRSDSTRVAQYSFRGDIVTQPSWDVHITNLVVDEPRQIAYVISGPYWYDHIVRAVPLKNAILDPFPPDGIVYPISPDFISVLLSGNLSPADVQMDVDGIPVAATYDPSSSILAYPSASALGDGDHHGLVTGTDGLGQPVRLEWNFSVDTRPPEITLSKMPDVVRDPHVTVQGWVNDSHLARATINGANLTVDAGGSFQSPIDLTEGGNLVVVRADDVVHHHNVSSFVILYVPATTRFGDGDLSLSIEFPSTWTAEKDVTIDSTHLDLLVKAPAAGGFAANFNVIATGPLTNYSEGALGTLAYDVLGNLSGLPQFRVHELPHPATIPGFAAVTFGFSFAGEGAEVYERQYILSNQTMDRSWVLTFAAASTDAVKYDRLFQWIAESARPESTVPETSFGFYLALGVGAAVAATAVGVILLLRFRVRASSANAPRTPETQPLVPPASEAQGPGESQGRPPKSPPNG